VTERIDVIKKKVFTIMHVDLLKIKKAKNE